MSNRKKEALPLEALGMLVHETRLRKNLTQQRAARGAGISRTQWALLEQGHNLSAVFIQKVASYLELSVIPLGEGLQAATERGAGVDVTALLGLADELVAFASSFADRLRTFAVDAILPASERSRDAEAISKLIARTKEGSPQASKQLIRAIHDLAADGVVRNTAAVSRGSAKRSTRKKQKG